jgi:hypothetical protein
MATSNYIKSQGLELDGVQNTRSKIEYGYKLAVSITGQNQPSWYSDLYRHTRSGFAILLTKCATRDELCYYALRVFNSDQGTLNIHQYICRVLISKPGYASQWDTTFHGDRQATWAYCDQAL